MSGLETTGFRLRPWEEDNAAALHAAFGDAGSMRYWDCPPTRDVTETRDMIRGSRAAGPRVHVAYAIVRRAGGQVVGMTNYHDRRDNARRLAIGWILLPAWRRRGIMRESVPALLSHYFIELNAHRVEARIEPDNLPSIRLAEVLGFEREGLLRDWIFVGGRPRTIAMYALLRPRWDQVSSTSSP